MLFIVILKGFSLMRKHTASEQNVAASLPSVPLIEHVLTFFEPLVATCFEQSQRGAPEKLSVAHLLLACIVGLVEQVSGPTDLWRLILLRPIGSFAPVQLTDRAVRQRLLAPTGQYGLALGQSAGSLCHSDRLPGRNDLGWRGSFV